MRDDLVPCAGAVVIDKDGRLLLIRRGHEPSAGLWSLPGGRIEAGETAEQAARREVCEETGLEVEIGALLLTAAIGDYLVHDFAATVVGGSLRAGDDASDVRWVSAEEIASLATSAGLIEALHTMRVM